MAGDDLQQQQLDVFIGTSLNSVGKPSLIS